MKPETSPQFASLVSGFNGLQGWAVSLILYPDSVKERLASLVFVVKCAHHSQKMGNFNAAMALFAATNDPAISRLRATWKGVPSKISGYLNDLRALADPKNNHSCYAAAVKAQPPPLVPYIAIISKYLFSMDDANPDYLGEDKSSFNLVKFRMIHAFVTSQLAFCQNSDSVLDAPQQAGESVLVSFFAVQCAKTYDNKSAYERSLAVEPRET